MTALEIASVGAALLVLAVLAWMGAGQGLAMRLRRWRTWRMRLRALYRQGHCATRSSLRSLHAAVPRSASTWRPLGTRRSRPTLARFLFVSDAAAVLPALLSAIEPKGPVHVNLPADEEPFWRWWKLPHLIAIELCPPPLPPEPPKDILWLHAQRLLARTRAESPLDGIVLCVSPALLCAAAQVSLPLTQLLARRIHETPAALHQTLPLHLLVTGLQDLPGYATVRAALPARLLEQVFGWRAPPAHAPAQALWEQAALTWQNALHDLRLALLVQERSAGERHDIHRFVEAALALEPGLQRLHQTLMLEQTPRLLWQGIYFSAGAAQPAFIHDLFERFLPASAALANNLSD